MAALSLHCVSRFEGAQVSVCVYKGSYSYYVTHLRGRGYDERYVWEGGVWINVTQRLLRYYDILILRYTVTVITLSILNHNRIDS